MHGLGLGVCALKPVWQRSTNTLPVLLKFLWQLCAQLEGPRNGQRWLRQQLWQCCGHVLWEGWRLCWSSASSRRTALLSGLAACASQQTHHGGGLHAHRKLQMLAVMICYIYCINVLPYVHGEVCMDPKQSSAYIHVGVRRCSNGHGRHTTRITFHLSGRYLIMSFGKCLVSVRNC
jgi:hypothetical protein